MPEFIETNRLYLCVLLGIFVGMPLIWSRREKIGLTKPWHVIPASFFMQLVSVITTQLFGALEKLIFHGSDRKFALYGIFLMSTFVFMALAKVCKRDWRDVLDVVAIFGCPALFIMRIDCLFAHCCDGVFIPGTSVRWPTTPAEMLFFAVMFVVLLRREKKDPPKGTQYFLIMLTYSIFRFFVEWVRVTPWNSMIHPGHLWSLLSFAIGMAMYSELMKRGAGKTRQAGRSGMKC